MKRTDADYAEMARMVKPFGFFADYAEDELAKHLEFLDVDRRTYEKGEIVFREGDPATRIGLILKGSIHACLEMPYDSRCVMQTMSRGYLAGGMILIVPQEKHLCTCEAVDGCEVATLSTARALEWRKDGASAGFMRAIEAQQFEFAVEITKKCMILSQPSVEKRILAYMGLRCRSENTNTITVAGTEAKFASYLGAHPVSVSRALNKLRDEGKISYNRNVLTLLTPPPPIDAATKHVDFPGRDALVATEPFKTDSRS